MRAEIPRFAITLAIVIGVLVWAQQGGALVWEPIYLSLRIALAAMLWSLAVGIGIAVLLTWRKLPAADFMDALLNVPLVLPPTVLGYYLIVSMGPESAIGRGFHWLTGGELAFTFNAAVIAAAIGSLPLVVRSVKVGLESIDPSFQAAARTLGASPFRVFFTISLPLATPGVIAGAMIGFARSLGDYGATMMFASARPHDNLPTGAIAVIDYIVADREAQAQTMAITMTVVGIAMLYLANRLTKRLQRRG